MNVTTRLSRSLRAISTTLSQPSLFRAFPRFYSQLNRQRPSLQTYITKPRIAVPQITTRYNSSDASNTDKPSPLTDRPSNPDTDAANAEQNRARREKEPAYQLTFTCKPCGERSTHRVSKHGYHRGTVLIRCPGCENRHVISDHLKIFFNHSMTLEDVLAQSGKPITKGALRGDVEFWEDGRIVRTGEPKGEVKPEESGEKKDGKKSE
ncbi:DNL-type zinc finger protein [Aspergillus stella-maris]|uniref:DNL-type zinc finger protein n=1 Tax=Aspergillus stella-maris TaxID=1810926 RepID=UPI003CCD04AD